jgi:amino-acid N-acetyltransferase
MPFISEQARPHDLGRVLDLLRAEKLPEHGVVEQFGHYLVVRDLGEVVGTCGLELYEDNALLRSLVVEPASRRQGAGDCLVRGAVSLGQKLGVRGLYLLTTSAQRYFERYGFQSCPRGDAPAGIRDSWELRQGCPSTAAFMRRALAQ